METCYHCGLPIPKGDLIAHDGREFCCAGCKTVYDILSENNLTSYYDMQSAPGTSPKAAGNRFDYLDNREIVQKLLDFDDADRQSITLHIPQIHCSSCIWILENLHRLQPAIGSARVNFPEKKVRITYDSTAASLKDIVLLLASIGYEPNISLEDYSRSRRKADNGLTIKLGVAFFSFGNIMLLSFPEYFEVSEFWLDKYRNFFRLLIFLLALPSFLYSASGYYLAAWKSIRARIPSIEIPIALGIIVMFVRSVVDMTLNHGPGFFDSMAGLIFFMLLGKTFQSKTYDFLSFERDYRSYFPVAVTRIKDGKEENVPVYNIAKGDRLLIRNQEIIPADCILMTGQGSVDYSFVTGEALPVEKSSGDKLFAGGRQIGGSLEVEVLKPVSQSYLTSLWSDKVFEKKDDRYRNITTKVSRYFTPVLLILAVGGFIFWYPTNPKTAFDVFTAVLIVACPCALALTAPFTLGNIVRLFGYHKFYLKDARVTEELAAADVVVFDKTGTLTSASSPLISYQGEELTATQTGWLKNLLRESNHPLSRMLYDYIPTQETIRPQGFSETSGSGMEAYFGPTLVRVGSASFTGCEIGDDRQTRVCISIDQKPIGCFVIKNRYREGIESLTGRLSSTYKLVILSGDNSGEREVLERFMPRGTQMLFNQKPNQKLEFVRSLQEKGHKVIMIGDGLNDAGALAQSDAGIAVAENVNVFSPACDAILDASMLERLDDFLWLSKRAMKIMAVSFGLSLLYNVVGLSFALSGNLDPLFAAIIMPLSTINIVGFVTLAGNLSGRRLKRHKSTENNSAAMTNVMFYRGTPA